MLFKYASDLHLECINEQEIEKLISIFLADNTKNTLLLAGDICQITGNEEKFIYFLNSIKHNWKNIVYVLGNHEYYEAPDPEDIPSKIRFLTKDIKNLYLLDNDVIVLDNITIGGTTLWYDRTHPNVPILKYQMNDDRYIDTKFLNQVDLDAQKFLYTLNCCDILLTHYGVTDYVVPRWRGNKLNIFFYRDISKQHLDRIDPDYIIHGHTHDELEYVYGNTKICTNPLGYPGEFYKKNFKLKEFTLNATN